MQVARGIDALPALLLTRHNWYNCLLLLIQLIMYGGYVTQVRTPLISAIDVDMMISTTLAADLEDKDRCVVQLVAWLVSYYLHT